MNSEDARREKLRLHEEHAPSALEFIVRWLGEEPELLIAVSRGRHAEGSLLYGDRLMYEYDDERLLSEAAQELGDAINYISTLLQRRDSA